MRYSLELGKETNNIQATAQILNEIAKLLLKQAQDGNTQAHWQNDNIVNLANHTHKTATSAEQLAQHMGDIGAQLISLRALRG